MAKADGDAVKEGPELIHDDQGIKEPEKEPVKVKREAYLGLHERGHPVLERETSGLKHLRRRRVITLK